METQHTETVVEKAVAYVKDMFGIPGDKASETPVPTAVPEDDATSDEALRLDPHAYAFNKIVERSQQITDTEHPNSAIEEHERAAEQIDRAEGLVHQALDEIQDISHGMREKIIDEKTRGGKGMPSESDMRKADEVGKAADRNEEALDAAGRRADEVRSWR